MGLLGFFIMRKKDQVNWYLLQPALIVKELTLNFTMRQSLDLIKRILLSMLIFSLEITLAGSLFILEVKQMDSGQCLSLFDQQMEIFNFQPLME